jgi:hypothetical protein
MKLAQHLGEEADGFWCMIETPLHPDSADIFSSSYPKEGAEPSAMCLGKEQIGRTEKNEVEGIARSDNIL